MNSDEQPYQGGKVSPCYRAIRYTLGHQMVLGKPFTKHIREDD